MQSSQLTTKLELLSPARDLECATVALKCGADAIFIGGPSFGARAAATNSLESLKDIVSLAHSFKAKVHVTVNTLLHDNELLEAQDLIYKLSEIGVDVLIVQDLGIFKLKIPKNLELHASTQCCIDTVEKLKFYEKLGIKQVVMPREFTLAQIKEFHEACPNLKLEAFVMGALCVGVSGICHISDLLKHRSANRGECAQICRLPMQLFKDDKEIAVGHLLSLKDNNQEQHLQDLIKAGVSSFKLEGRLKDPLYVANTTAYFNQKLDKAIKELQKEGVNCARLSVGKCSYNFTPDLNKTFNRGFTDGLLMGNKENLVNDLTPKFLGVKTGKIISCRRKGNLTIVALKLFNRSSLNNGDGLTYLKAPVNKESNLTSERVHTVEGFRVNKVVQIKGNEATFEVLGSLNLKPNTVVFKNVDVDFESKFKQKDFALRTVEYSLDLSILENFDKNLDNKTNDNKQNDVIFADNFDKSKRSIALVLKAQDNYNLGITYTKTLVINYSDELKAISKDKLEQTLVKKVDPLFVCSKTQIKGNLNKVTAPISLINTLRRECVAQFIECFKQSENTKISQDTEASNQDNYLIPFKLVSEKTYPYPRVDSRLVLNTTSRQAYEECGCSVGLDDIGLDKIIKDSVMTTKYCLINQYGKCSKQGGKVTGFTLLVSGQKFKILCDCKNCYMHVLKI